jgi:hypothetical protein
MTYCRRPLVKIFALCVMAALTCAAAADSASTGTPSSVTLPDGSRYEGESRGGLFNGQGTLEWRNHAKYRGGFKDGLMSGSGKLITPIGDIYESQFAEGLPNGKGTEKLHNGDRYEGNFKDGLFSGKGIYRAKDGTVYRGDFNRGDFSGKGSIAWANGNRYRGDVADWRMSGMGVFSDKQGNRYNGQFRDNLYQGKGDFHSGDGDIFKGQFDRGEFSGQGAIHYAAGDDYRGTVKNWRPEGEGFFSQKDGGRYRGELSDGLYNGEGEFTYANGDRYVGEFKDGYFHGKGTLYFKRPENSETQRSGIWEYGQLQSAGDAPQQEKAALRAEDLLSHQDALVDKALEEIKPGAPGEPDMYFVSFGGNGDQNVFMKESRYTKRLFENRYGTAGRSIALYNSGDGGTRAPLATTANLRRVLLGIGKKMNRDEDLLFLYLTSHGSRNHELSVELPGLHLPGLSAQQLADILRDTGIKWKVIVVSACYSGGFVDSLKDDHSLIISSARRDRVSFGCSDDADFTFFGRAYFADALPKGADFKQAFAAAKMEVAKWEKDDHYDPSFPQLSSTAAIERQLDKWRHTMQCHTVANGGGAANPTGARRQRPEGCR